MDVVTQLEWIPPCETSLLSLAHCAATSDWHQLRRDPGLVLLLLAAHPVQFQSPHAFSIDRLLDSATPLGLALQHLENDESLASWTGVGEQILNAALRYAREAEHLATELNLVDPQIAWISGLLAPLGWLAMTQADAKRVQTCLNDPICSTDPSGAQRVHWSADQSSIARRLSRRWRLPDWLRAVCAHLGLKTELALLHGAERNLFQVVQLAVTITQQQEPLLGLPVGATVSELLDELHLSSLPSRSVESCSKEIDQEDLWSLRSILTLAVENAQLREQSGSGRLEQEIDLLHQALEAQCQSEETRLQQRKLEGLAELAAGAGHEINNPLAVISGQAQYLLRKLSDPGHCQSLETIVAQTRRVYGILRELMQFARPSQPTKRPVDVLRLVDEVGVSLMESASKRDIELLGRSEEELRASTRLMLEIDEHQIRTALTALIQNAIEHAGVEGSVRVSVVFAEPSRLEIHVENSGADLSMAQREHAFDPFFCGRATGRRLGMGLPTAWALARANGGGALLASQPGESVRFVLWLPLSQQSEIRLSECG